MNNIVSIMENQLMRLVQIKNFLGPEVSRLFVLAVTLGFLWFVVESAFVLVIEEFVRALRSPDDSSSHFLRSLFFLLVVGLVRGLLFMARAYYSAVTERLFVFKQRARILRAVFSELPARNSHEVMSVFGDLVRDSGQCVLHLSRFLNAGTAVLFLSLAGFYLAPAEMLIALAFIALMGGTFQALNSKIRGYGEANVNLWIALNRRLLRGLNNLFFLRIYNLTTGETDAGLSDLRNHSRHVARFHLLSAFKSGFPILGGACALCAVAYIGHFHLNTPLTKILGFSYIFVRMTQGLSDASQALSAFRFSLPSLLKLKSWLEERERAPAVVDGSFTRAALDSEAGRFEVTARDLEFAYPGEAPLFRNLSFEIRSGDVLLIQGPSGVGKSTLLMLIAGLKRPTAGRVLICGKPADEVQPEWAGSLAYVGPDPYLIYGTVRENLLYGHQDSRTVSDGEIATALDLAGIQDKARDAGLERVMEEAPDWSTGELQRLSIARGLLRRPRVMILDEATANLDSEMEKSLLTRIRQVNPELVLIVVSHKSHLQDMAARVIALPSR